MAERPAVVVDHTALDVRPPQVDSQVVWRPMTFVAHSGLAFDERPRQIPSPTGETNSSVSRAPGSIKRRRDNRTAVLSDDPSRAAPAIGILERDARLYLQSRDMSSKHGPPASPSN